MNRPPTLFLAAEFKPQWVFAEMEHKVLDAVGIDCLLGGFLYNDALTLIGRAA